MTKNLLCKAFLLLALVGGVNCAWAAVNTTLIDGITLPSTPTTSYNLSTGNVVWSGTGASTKYLIKLDANGNGIMEASYGGYGSTSATRTFGNGADGTNDGTWSTTGTSWSAKDGSIFRGSSAYSTSANDTYVGDARRGNLRTTRTFAFRFTGAGGFSALVKSQGNTDGAAAVLAVYELNTSTGALTSAGSASSKAKAVDVVTVDGLDKNKTYVAFIYGMNSSNGELYEIAFLAPPAAADAPTITTQPASAAYGVGATPADLTVVASASAGVLSYQWYKNTDQDKTAKEADKIAGATSATLDKANISTASENTTYYYVVVTDDNGSTTSDLATITVVEQEPYATPTITEKNGTVQITSSDDITVSQIKYSLDGGSSWNTYSIPFNLATPTTVKAKVVQGEDPSYTDSEVASTDCYAIPEKIDGSFSITLYNDDSNWTKTASQDGSSTIDTWTGKADTYLDGYIIALDNEGKTGSNIKALSTGNAINGKSTIKGSNGRRIKFTIPTGVKVNRITIYSYTNGDSDNKYASTWSFDGETPDMIGLSLRDNDENNGKSESSASNPDIRVFYFDTPLEGSFYLNNSGYQQCFYMVLDYTQTVSATITSSGYASFSSTYALDFSGVEGLEAYIATSGSETTVTMEKVTGTVAAGTGLVLKGDADTYYIPVVASGTDYSATNRLWAITSNQNVTAAGTGWTNYVLAKQNDNVVFAPVTGENSVAVTAGHAALCLANPSGSRAVSMVFGGEATGIDNLTPALSEGEGVVYNLRGQRVAQPTKGLYIVNGKKVVIK